MTTKQDHHHLSLQELNAMIVKCARGQFRVADLQQMYNACEGQPSKFCRVFFARGSNGRQHSTMACELFAHGSVDVVRWVTSNIPLPTLVNSGQPSLDMLGALASRLRQSDKDEVFCSFTPEFFKLVAVDRLRAVRVGTLDLLQLLASANNVRAYDNVQALLNPTKTREEELEAQTLRLERTEFELREERSANAQLRHNLGVAQQTADELLAMRQEMYSAIDERDINKATLQKKIVNLDIERQALARKEAEAEQRQRAAEQSIAAARLARTTAEARVQTERQQRQVVASDLSSTTEKVATLERTLGEMQQRTAAYEQDQETSDTKLGELQRRIGELQRQVLDAEEQTDKTDEQRIALKLDLERRIAALDAERVEIKARADATAAELRQAREAKRSVDAELLAAKQTADTLRERLDSMAQQTSGLESKLEEASGNLRLCEQQLAESQRQLALAKAEHDNSNQQHSQQTARLRRENEKRTAELAEAQNLLVEAAESIETERRRAEEACRQLSATSREAEQANRRLEELRERERQVQAELQRSALSVVQSEEEKRRLREESDRRAEGIMSQLSEARDRLERTRADLRNESDAKLQTERQNAELQRQLAEMAAKIDTLASTSKSGGGGGSALERTTSVSTMKKSRPAAAAAAAAAEATVASMPLTPRKSGTLREGGRPRTLRRTEASMALVSQDQESLFASTSGASENEVATAVFNQRANYQLLKTLVECVTTVRPEQLRTMLASGASANTRDPDSRKPLLEIALHTYHGMHRDQKRLGDEAKKTSRQAGTIIELLIQNGAEWADMDAFVDKLTRAGYAELGAEAAKKAERSTALATQLPESVVRKLDERDELAPFCQAVLRSSAVNVKKHIGSVTNLDRVPKQSPARGRRYIHIAVLNASVSIVYDLVLHGADVTLLDNDGCSPLRLALLKVKNVDARRKIVEYLLAGGADPNETCPTPLEDTTDSGDSGSDEQPNANGSSTMTAAVLSRLKRTSHRGKAAAKAAGKTSLALAEELGDHELVVCLNSSRFHKVTMGHLQSYIKVAVETAITVETMIVCGELKTTAIEHLMFEKYSGVFHSFNPQFIAKYGADYTLHAMRRSLGIVEGTISDSAEQEKIQKMLLADLQYVEAALRARSSSGANLGNKSLHWKLLLALNQCILAVNSKLFDVSELLGDPARRQYNEAAREFLVDSIEQDRADIVEYMLLKRRDRIFGDLDLETPVADVYTPIEYAAHCGATATLEMLLRHQQSRLDLCGVESGKTLVAIAAESEQPLAVVLIDHFRFKNQLTTQATPNAHNYAIVRKGQRKLTVLHLAVLAARKDLLAHCVDEVPFHLRAKNSAGQTPLEMARALLLNAENRDESYKLALTTCVTILTKAGETSNLLADEPSASVAAVSTAPATRSNGGYYAGKDDDDDDFVPPPPPPALDAPPELQTPVDEGSFDSDEPLYEQATQFVVEREFGDADGADEKTAGRRRRRRTKKRE